MFATVPLNNGFGNAGMPCFPAGNALTEYDETPTCRTSGSRARLAAIFGAYNVMSRSEGFVLAKKVLYDDCVRRAAATDPRASPPIAPTSTMIVR